MDNKILEEFAYIISIVQISEELSHEVIHSFQSVLTIQRRGIVQDGRHCPKIESWALKCLFTDLSLPQNYRIVLQ